MLRLWALMCVAGLALVLAGCARDEAGTDAPRTFPGATVRLGRLDSSSEVGQAVVRLVARQQGEWSATRDARLAIVEEPLTLSEAGKKADIVVFRGERWGDLLAAGVLRPIPLEALTPSSSEAESDATEGEDGLSEASDPYDFSDLLPDLRDQILRDGEVLMGLPLGQSALVLAYRRDAFEDARNQEAARAAGLELKPPQTYEELDALARFFNDRDWDHDGQPDSGIALALGQDPEGVGLGLLLARAAALGLHPDYISFLFDDATMEPRIVQPPFVEALEALTALAGAGPPDVASFDAPTARQAFREGAVALLIDRAERAGQWSEPSRPIPVGVAVMPGALRVFEPTRQRWSESSVVNRPTILLDGGGWIAGLLRPATEQPAALDFLTYLTSSDTASRLVGDPDCPLLPVRSSQVGLERLRRDLGVRGWGPAVSQTLTARKVIPSLRIPEASAYLGELDQARVTAVGGEPAQTVLQQAAAAWDARTDRLGRQRQAWYYQRSLGMRTVQSRPPAP